MKRITTRATLFALCLAALGVLGACSADDAAPTGDAAGAAGGTPIVINVAPKPDYVDVDAPGTATRATTDDAIGTVAWADGDRIYVILQFDDAATTIASSTMVYDAATTQWTTYGTIIPDVNPDGTPIDLSAYASKKGFPLAPAGATKLLGAVGYYFDGKWMIEGTKLKRRTIDRGNMMMFMQTDIPLGTALNVAMEHTDVCLMFTGLEPGKGYALTGETYATEFEMSDLTKDPVYTSLPAGSFKAAADGSLVICLQHSSTALTVELVKEENSTVVYKKGAFATEYGKRYHCRANSGGIDPGTHPDLLPPLPIVPGNKVQLTNGYYITMPTATEYASEWSPTNPNATEMENDPCAGHGDWRIPTMRDWEAILGWTTSWHWSQDAVMTPGPASDAWNTPLLPNNNSYWSSTLDSTGLGAWCIEMNSTDSAYSLGPRWNRYYLVRCVQK